MQLSRRLQTVASLVPKCGCLADIGTDHAYVPVWCVKNGVCRRALACDVRPGPLKIAEKSIRESGLAHAIQTRLSDGLDAILPGEADAVVIAGMGGLLIADILSRGKTVFTAHTRLILQPMTAVEELRVFLYQNGFRVTDEHVVAEEDKFYQVLEAALGQDIASERDIIVGRNLQKEPDYTAYLAYRVNKEQRIIAGMQRAASVQEGIAAHRRRLELFQQAMAEQEAEI